MSTKTVQSSAVPSFPKEDLIANGRDLFNVAPEVVAGALYGVTGELTIEETQGKIDDYLTRPINNEGGK